eukprot:1158918-Pelagomonas_calceolata.AAC.9
MHFNSHARYQLAWCMVQYELACPVTAGKSLRVSSLAHPNLFVCCALLLQPAESEMIILHLHTPMSLLFPAPAAR